MGKLVPELVEKQTPGPVRQHLGRYAMRTTKDFNSVISSIA